jgi:DNA-binding transcriptional ArsR family regulator
MKSQPLGVGSPALRALFPSKARRAVVETLFSGRLLQASVSELARRAGLTPRAVAVEIQNLEEVGLVEVEAIGSAHVVRPNEDHPVTKALRELLSAAAAAPHTDPADRKVRRSLAAYGAPLLGEEPRAFYSLVEALLRGLRLARKNATVLRVLPVVLAKHAQELDWTDLKERARGMNLRAELGMLLDLTGTVAGLPELRTQADDLADGRRKRQRFFPEVASSYERKLAEQRSPESATRWHFAMNMTEDSFRVMVRKHVHA